MTFARSRRSRRVENALRRLRHGLRPGADVISPVTPTDLYMAHVSVYWFAARFVRGRRVLDLGCGTGYGAADLRGYGATEVVGVDRDAWAVRYARRHYRMPGLSFQAGDIERLGDSNPGLGRFDVILSSNVFPLLGDVKAGLEEVRKHLVPNGRFLLVVPPITNEETLEANRRDPSHRTNLYIEEWVRLLGDRFGWLRAFEHAPKPGMEPDFADPFPSALTPYDFEFFEVPVHRLGLEMTLGAVFLAEVPGAEPGPRAQG